MLTGAALATTNRWDRNVSAPTTGSATPNPACWTATPSRSTWPPTPRPWARDVIRVNGIIEFLKALDVARAAARTTVIHIDTDPLAPVPSSESWWDVPVSQVSQLDSTRQAYQTFQQRKATQLPSITPVA
jgi:hypothetical protein